MTDIENGRFFAEELLKWYRRAKRDLPWRRTRDPYRIWVSEVMLQQTRVETVIPYYERFIAKYPTLEALADAPEEEVLKLWEGLGYYSRARNLHAAVREVREAYGGVVPDDKEAFASLKGVGSYTAGAVLSIAFNKPEPAVDGNVLRVLARFFCIEDDVARAKVRGAFEKLARKLIPDGQAGDFNQALMELGATVCTPRSPHCLPCPVMERCAGRLAGKEEKLPVKTKVKKPRPERRAVAMVGADGHLLIRRRPNAGLLAGMWELPHVLLPAGPLSEGADAEKASAGATPATAGDAEATEVPAVPAGSAGEASAATAVPGSPASYALTAPGEDAEAASRPNAFGLDAERIAAMRALAGGLAEADGIAVIPVEWLTDAEHTFSHIRWDMMVFRCRAGAGFTPEAAETLPPHYRWVSLDELGQYAFPNAFRRLIRDYFAGKL